MHMASNVIKKITPMLDRILVQRAEPMATTEGGIVVPEDSRTKMMQGTVIAVGPGARGNQSDVHVPPLVKAGDRVLLPEYGGTRSMLSFKPVKEFISECKSSFREHPGSLRLILFQMHSLQILKVETRQGSNRISLEWRKL
uniref:10 kDa heat shock protein, mitochondrial n=1 Tax=Glossina pallidipes TaxID=7398 RepID=A0A1B0ADE6_GLOPL